MKRTVLVLSSGAMALVAALFGQANRIEAQTTLLNGKTIVVGGIPGCDCTQKVTECYCWVSS
jgi:hypothetical protein